MLKKVEQKENRRT